MTPMVTQAITDVECERCGRTPTKKREHALNHGYCIVCWDYRVVKQQEAEIRAIARLKALHTGQWRTPAERNTP